MALRGRKTRSALARVEELRHVVAAERRRERELDGERSAAQAAREAAREQLVTALAAGGDGAEEQRALEEAETRASVRWDEIKEAARRRVVAADRAVGGYIADNFDAIKAEIERDREVCERLVAAAEELQAAIRAANEEAGAWTPLLNARRGGAPSGPQGAVLALDSLGQEVKRTLARGIRQPTPPEVLSEDDPQGPAAPVLEVA